jgi:uncharacterized protein YuzE
MAKEAKVDYDEENDILYIYTGERARDSLEIDRFVIDFSPGNKIVGIEIFDAKKFIKEYLELEDEEFVFSEHASISVIQSKELSLVKINLMIKLKGKEIEKLLPIAIPKKALSV